MKIVQFFLILFVARWVMVLMDEVVKFAIGSVKEWWQGRKSK